METTIINNTELNEIIENAILPYQSKSDFDLREDLIGCGISAAIYARQFHQVGTEEYKYLCVALTDKLSEISAKAREGTKDFEVEIEYKGSSKETVFGYSTTCTERTQDEVRERIKQKQFTDLNTGRKIKPVFLKFEIKEKN